MITIPQPTERWRHYKGKVMTVIGLACFEADGNLVVIYETPEGVRKVRPIHEWLGRVPGPDMQRRYVHIEEED